VHFSTVFVDESGDLGFGQGSSKYITIGALIARQLSRAGVLPFHIDVSVIDSHNSGGLQAADFVVGSIQRKYARDDPSYYRIIAPAMVIEKRLF